MNWHRPRAYRYEVAHPATFPRILLNRYDRQVIGASITVGKYAYCLLWASPSP